MLEMAVFVTLAFRRNASCAAEFQRMFNASYRVRRGTDWQRVYYALMEKHTRVSGLRPNPDYSRPAVI